MTEKCLDATIRQPRLAVTQAYARLSRFTRTFIVREELRLFKIRLLLLLCLGLLASAVAESRIYVVDVQIKPTSKDDYYYVDLLRLLLNASKAPDEVIDIHFYGEKISQARWVAVIEKDEGNNVLWTMTSTEREKSMRAIRVPIYKGLMGYRALVIRKEDEKRFAKVKTRDELMTFTFGQGLHWPDTAILRKNQFRILEAVTKESLYKMSAAKRFDMFPRGVIEILTEDDSIRQQNLMVEPHLILHYRTDMYFFVNKNNTELAERLEKGWDVIQRNGEFDKLFYNTDRIMHALNFLKQPGHIIVELDNPFLPEDTPLDKPGYWLDINTLR